MFNMPFKLISQCWYFKTPKPRILVPNRTLTNDDRGGPKTSLLISAENINALISLVLKKLLHKLVLGYNIVLHIL